MKNICEINNDKKMDKRFVVISISPTTNFVNGNFLKLIFSKTAKLMS